MAKEKKSHLQVFVRCRPVFYNKNQEPEEACVRVSSNNSVEMVNLRNIKETLRFEFQQVFTEDSSQEEVFGTVVQPVLSRFTNDLQNVSVFAYGPTGSGKTHTILGNDDAPGFIPLALHHLFARIRQYASTDVDASMSMSYLEIYQEKIYDLLANSKKLEAIRQDQHGTIYVPGLTESVIEKFSDFESKFMPACKSRRVAATRINERSSRSHTLLLIKLTTHERVAPYLRKTAKLSIVDLAGSEDNRVTANKGIRLKESSAINTSLHVLAKVVGALVDRKPRVPYRDSKLTRLMQDSLGGSAHTCMVVNVSPEMSSIFDTHRALTFAVASKSVINRPFTRESIVIPTPKSAPRQRVLSECENTPEPLFSPDVRQKASKRKLKLDKFDDMGNLKGSSESSLIGCKSSRDNEAQQRLIDEIRTSSQFFKKLQQTPKPTSPLLPADDNDTDSHDSQAQVTSSGVKGQVFSIKMENDKCFLLQTPSHR